MNFETAQKAAKRLGVTVRAIQKWAKEGKIPYSHKVGRDWMIPTDAVSPGKKRPAEKKTISSATYPLTRFYVGGSIDEYISSLVSKDEKSMARCEYLYMIGELQESEKVTAAFLTSSDEGVRTMSALYSIFLNLSMGNLDKSGHASEIIKGFLEKSLEEENESYVAVGILSVLAAKLALHLPIGEIPKMSEYVKYLDKGLRAFGCYLIAYDEYLEKRYEKSLGVSETALYLCEDNYVVGKIYLHIVSAMSYINLFDTESAKAHIEKAYDLASPVGIIMPFVEHYNLLGGLLENTLKLEHTEYYNKILETSKQYNSSWIEIYNQNVDTPVADNLTNIEFTIAMLYSRNWRVKEIASHLHLSERTVTNYISYIYDKLHINSKKELEKYMFK